MNTNKSDQIHLKMVTVPAIKGQMASQFRDLMNTVQEITGFNITIEEAETYLVAIEALKSGDAQIAWLGAKAYIEVAHDANIEAFAVGTRGKSGRSTYRTLFLARADSKIETINDIRGKSLILSEPGSTSGDLIPRHELIKNNLDPDIKANFSEVTYTGNQESSVTSVLSGIGDVAAVSEINYENLINKNILNASALKIIHSSPEIPGAPLVYSKNLPVEVRAKLKQAVIDAHKYGKVSGYGHDVTNYKSQEEARSEFYLSYLRPQWRWPVLLLAGFFIFLTIFITAHLGINPIKAIGDTYKYLFDLLGRLWPPDFSNFPTLILAMIETIEIGILGTVLATCLSIPIGLFSAKNVAPNKIIYHLARTITIFFRAIPEFIMAMILVIAVGFGALPGVLALGLHTMGFLAKFFAEEIEHVNTSPIEALEATGANKFQIIMFAVVPQIIQSFVGFTLYILDRNIRMATMLGIVGAGGIGYRLQSAFRMFKYQEVTAIILIIFITIYAIDILSAKLRFYVR